MSSTTLCSRAVRSVGRLGSSALWSRANVSVAPIMASISAMVDSILSRSCAFSTVSARNRSSVSGVRRSCEMAASRRVRFSMRSRKRVCMSLKARAACRVSMVPVSGSGARIDVVPEPLGGRGQRAQGVR